MLKFYIDAFADMFGEELKENNLNLAPSKLQKNSKIIDFQGYKEKEDFSKILQDIKKHKYTIIPLTSDEWFEFFKKDLDNNDEIIFFSVSLKLLHDQGKALKSAFAKLNKTYPKQKAILIDTLTVSRGTSKIASLTQLVYQKSQDLDQALDFADTLIGKFVSVIALDNVQSLKNSPLLSHLAENFTGTSLNMKPIISINTDGKFSILDKEKGFKSAVLKLYGTAKKNGRNIADYAFSIVNFNADNESQALYDKFRQIVNENEIKIVPLSLNNASILGGKCVSITFHSKF